MVRARRDMFTAWDSSQAAAWTPDSRRIVYRGTRMGSRELYWRAADGTGNDNLDGLGGDVVIHARGQARIGRAQALLHILGQAGGCAADQFHDFIG